jgi:triosephosphate isomerase (TIM)
VGRFRPLHGPLLILNFKTYIEATGKRAIDLAQIAGKVSKESGVAIIVAPQFADIKAVSENSDVTVFSQHLDPIKPGAFTGHVLADSVKSAGAEGSILNHSERRITASDIHTTIKLCAQSDLYSLVCADSAQASAEIAEAKPDVVAIEPPDLIGTGISVSKSRPQLITDSLHRIRAVNPTVKILCGAGITTSEDVSTALRLGTEGVLVASSVVKSKDPQRVLSSMANAMVSGG